MPVLKNAKHEKFIQNIVKGMTQTEAYKEAFGANYDDNAIKINANKLFNSSKVQERYKELLGKLEDKTIMSAKERMEWLTKVINGDIKEESKYWDDHQMIVYEKDADISTKIKAVDTLNKMSGEYITKVEGSMNVSYEDSLKELADTDEY